MLHSCCHTTAGDHHIGFDDAVGLYGGIVRPGPNSLLFESPNANRASYDAMSNCIEPFL